MDEPILSVAIIVEVVLYVTAVVSIAVKVVEEEIGLDIIIPDSTVNLANMVVPDANALLREATSAHIANVILITDGTAKALLGSPITTVPNMLVVVSGDLIPLGMAITLRITPDHTICSPCSM